VGLWRSLMLSCHVCTHICIQHNYVCTVSMHVVRLNVGVAFLMFSRHICASCVKIGDICTESMHVMRLAVGVAFSILNCHTCVHDNSTMCIQMRNAETIRLRNERNKYTYIHTHIHNIHTCIHAYMAEAIWLRNERNKYTYTHTHT
jgi:hypothetical protein